MPFFPSVSSPLKYSYKRAEERCELPSEARGRTLAENVFSVSVEPKTRRLLAVNIVLFLYKKNLKH